MEKYSSYNDSDLLCLDVVPSIWKKTMNKHHLLEKKVIVGENWSNYRLLSLTKEGVIYRDIDSGKGKFPESFDTYKSVEKGDIILCLYDIEETPRTIGLSDYEGMITGSYHIYQPVNMLGKFFYYWYLRIDNDKGLKPYYTGMRNVVRPTTFLSLPLYLPPLHEQQHIVSYLDEKTSLIDTLIQSKQKKITLLKEGIESFYFYRDRGLDTTNFKDYWFLLKPTDWDVVKFKDVFEEITDRNHPDERLLSVHQQKGVIYRDEQEQSVMNPSVDISNYKLVNEGDFVISLRSSEGGFELSDVRGLVSPVYVVLRPKFRIDDITFKYLFKSNNFIEELNRYITGIRDGKSIYFKDIKNIPIPVHREPDEQVIQKHRTILTLFKKYELEIRLLKEYRQSLISDVVTGKICVLEDG